MPRPLSEHPALPNIKEIRRHVAERRKFRRKELILYVGSKACLVVIGFYAFGVALLCAMPE